MGNVLVRIIIIMLSVLLFSCKNAPAPSPVPIKISLPFPEESKDELDAAIREVSDYLNRQLPRGSKLVILNIQSEYPALSEYIIDELIANTVNDRVLSMVDRHQLNAIRAEQRFQMSGEVDDNTAQALGRMAGAHIIISGAVSKIGDLYRLRIRALNVQTAAIDGQFNKNIPECPTILALVKSKATGYGTEAVSSVTQKSTSPAVVQPSNTAAVPVTPAPAPVIYKIGDNGPGGGIIFFDKTSYSNGWRYLEAAPVENEIKASWDTCVEMTGLLVINGVKGWRLPTREELNWMYNNLKMKDLGEFSNEIYWSSEEGWGWGARAMRFRNGEWLRTGTIAGDDAFVGKQNMLIARPVRRF